MPELVAKQVTLAYGSQSDVVHELTLDVPERAITSIIGRNGCGKSTLLRALARLMAPRAGVVLLDGESIQSQPTRVVARQLGLLAQSPTAPEAITVEDLARRGRYPHQSLLQPSSEGDRDAVERALDLTGMKEFRQRAVDQLSGGQRQRAWIAMALAQETPILLLDEPTTFLDIAHQVETLELIKKMNLNEGRTVVMALHNLGQACRYADFIVVMKEGQVVAEGLPEDTIDADLVREVFELDCTVVPDPVSGKPLVIPPAPNSISGAGRPKYVNAAQNNFDRSQLCSRLTRALGEDPVGHAFEYGGIVIAEMPKPWPRDTESARGLKADYLPQVCLGNAVGEI